VPVFRTKPKEFEARQFTGDNGHELMSWLGNAFRGWQTREFGDEPSLAFRSHGSTLLAEPSDWIIAEAPGTFGLCRDDDFASRFEEVA
jgi:hypothetical protein